LTKMQPQPAGPLAMVLVVAMAEKATCQVRQRQGMRIRGVR